MYIHHIAINSTHPSDFVMERRHGLADYLFLNIKSACTFLIKDKMYTIIPPAVILMDSYVPHKYFPTGEQYCDDYLHFSMDHSRNFLNQLTFPLNTPIFSSAECMGFARSTEKTEAVMTLTPLVIILGTVATRAGPKAEPASMRTMTLLPMYKSQ